MFGEDYIVLYKDLDGNGLLPVEVYGINSYESIIGMLESEGYQKEYKNREIHGSEHLDYYSHDEKGTAVVAKWLVSQTTSDTAMEKTIL